MDPQSGDIAAPALGLISDVGQVLELAPLEEALAGVLDIALHFGFVLGVTNSGRVDDEAPMLGIFQEAPGEDGVQRVRRGHRGRAVVDDQVLGDAAEEGPGRLQASDDVLQLLVAGGPQEAVARVAQHHQQSVYRAATAGRGVVDQAQAAEIHLRHLASRRVLHPHCEPTGPAPVPTQNESTHRLVGHRTAPGQQQLVNAGHLQPVAGEPPVDLVGPRG